MFKVWEWGWSVGELRLGHEDLGLPLPLPPPLLLAPRTDPAQVAEVRESEREEQTPAEAEGHRLPGLPLLPERHPGLHAALPVPFGTSPQFR